MASIKIEVPQTIQLEGPKDWTGEVDLSKVDQGILAERIQNAFQRFFDSRVNEKKENADAWIKAADEYLPEFLDGIADGSIQVGAGRKADPVATEMRKLLDKDIDRAVRKAGKKPSDISTDKRKELRAKLMDQHGTEYRAKAKELVELANQASPADDLELDI